MVTIITFHLSSQRHTFVCLCFCGSMDCWHGDWTVNKHPKVKTLETQFIGKLVVFNTSAGQQRELVLGTVTYTDNWILSLALITV